MNGMGHETENSIYDVCEATSDPLSVSPCSPSITVALVRHGVLTALPDDAQQQAVLKRWLRSSPRTCIRLPALPRWTVILRAMA